MNPGMNSWALLIIACSGLHVAAADLPRLTPAPQQMRWTSGEGSWLAAHALRGVAADAALPAKMAAIEQLANVLSRSLPAMPEGNLKLQLTTLPDIVPQRTRHEGYTLVVDGHGATVAAETAHGIHNGLTSLALLADAEKRIPCVSLVDWPDQQLRGTYVAGIRQAEERFDQFVKLKLNLVLLEDGELYNLNAADTCARFQEFAAQCRANFIDFVPELQSLGWGQLVLEREPHAVEATLVRRAAFPVRDRQVYAPDPPLSPPIAITNASFASGLEAWKPETYYGSWKPSTAAEALVVARDDAAGGHALQLTLVDEGAVRVAQEVTVQPNARYTVKCRIRTEDVVGVGAYLEVYGIDERGAGALIGYNNVRVTGTTDWQESSVIIDTGRRHRTLPGGALEDAGSANSGRGYERICIYVRLQDAMGRAWFDGVETVPRQAPNPLSNVVVTQSAQVRVESQDGNTLYEEGGDYTLEVPELRFPYALGKPLRVVLTERSRIQDGDTVLLTFNQAASEDVTCCPSEPLYDEFMRKSIATVVEKLDPKYLHIGHDEPRFFNRDQRCTDRHLSNAALFADTIKRIHDSARAAKPDIRVMMWDDAINPYHNGPHLGTSDVASMLPRDIIINVWWYDTAAMDVHLDKSVAFFMEQGFQTTGSPWFGIANARRWAQLFNEHKNNPRALGIIYTSWGGVPDPWAALKFTAEHAWSFGKPPFEQ
jgi:hypothetical protein